MTRKMKFKQPKFPNGTLVKAYANVIKVGGFVQRTFLGEGVVTQQLSEETVVVTFDKPVMYPGDENPQPEPVTAACVMECNLEKI